MSGLRMNKVVRFSAAAGFLIAILLLLAISAGKKQVASTSSDHILSNRPPVIVVGGSLYGDAKDKNWAGCQNPDHRTDEYCVSVGNDKYILSSKNYNPRISLACTTDDCKSWKIFMLTSTRMLMRTVIRELNCAVMRVASPPILRTHNMFT